MRNRIIALLTLSVTLTFTSACRTTGEEAMPQIKKITPLLSVESVDRCLPFWVERLGFVVVASVPLGDETGFAILVRDDVEIMLQSVASLKDDHPALAKEAASSTQMLYIEVEDLAAIEAALKGLELAIPKRVTDYGATEIGVRDPGGHLILFSKIAEQPEA